MMVILVFIITIICVQDRNLCDNDDLLFIILLL